MPGPVPVHLTAPLAGEDPTEQHPPSIPTQERGRHGPHFLDGLVLTSGEKYICLVDKKTYPLRGRRDACSPSRVDTAPIARAMVGELGELDSEIGDQHHPCRWG